MIPMPQSLLRTRHTEPTRGNSQVNAGSVERVPNFLPMTELAKQIIRQQWPLRHHANTLRRAQARSLIRTHVILLRQWRGAAVTTK